MKLLFRKSHYVMKIMGLKSSFLTFNKDMKHCNKYNASIPFSGRRLLIIGKEIQHKLSLNHSNIYLGVEFPRLVPKEHLFDTFGKVVPRLRTMKSTSNYLNIYDSC